MAHVSLYMHDLDAAVGHLRAVGKSYQWAPVNFTQMR
jgi:hypothetical protein